MKFNTLAIAALTLVAGTAAQAQSSVTLYGIADAYGQYINGAANLTRLQSGGLSGSRLGLRGSEDLGGGLRAMFVIESGINLDDGSFGQNAFWGRQAYVGIGSSSIGTVTLGRQYGSLYPLSGDFSEFSNVSTGASTTLIGGFGGYEPVRGSGASSATTLASSATDNSGPARINNSIKAESASFSGFKVGGLVGLGEATSGARGTHIYDIYARYTAGPLDAMLSYVADTARPSTTLSNRDVRTTSAALAYSFGSFRATGGVISVNDRTALNADGQGAWIGGDFRSGGNLFKAQYVQSKTKGSLADAKAQAFGVGYQYDLSKRTSLYSSVTYFKNEGAAGYNRASFTLPAGIITTGDRKLTEVVGGIRHTF